MVQAGSEIRIEASAKINLTLAVIGKRIDGYHDLCSIVMPVSLTDTLHLTATYAQVAITITVSPGVDLSKIGPLNHNLAVRAARLMQKRYAVNAGARIHIHKRIPIGGGLGGGSADAAGVILGLDRLWELHAPLEELLQLGAELGSDIPALIHGGGVLMEGRGERVSGLPQKEATTPSGFWLVIANPGVMCSTPTIFKKWQSSQRHAPPPLTTMIDAIQTGNVVLAARTLQNDLQTTVFEAYPEIAATAKRLTEAGCEGVLLSGSGASVFGLVRDRQQGLDVRKKIGPSLWHALARTLPKAPQIPPFGASKMQSR